LFEETTMNLYTYPHYEWCCETTTAARGEIIDYFYADKLIEVLEWMAANPPDARTRHEVVLVRDDQRGRSWAYMSDDFKLPARFKDADDTEWSRVPTRFSSEAACAGFLGGARAR
jgi:hypothetical protein